MPSDDRLEVSPGSSLGDVRLSVVAPLNIVLRRGRLFVRAAILATVVILALGILTRRYAAESAFMPNSTSLPTQSLAGLAAQFGFNAAALNGNGESVDFYADLVKSREIVTTAVQTTYRFATDDAGRDSVSGNLMDVYGIHGSTALDRLQKTVKKLDKDVSADADEQSGIVTVRVRAKWPDLAEQINARLLSLVNDFNVRRRESSAGIERRFIELRLADALHDLTRAEDDLRGFLEKNRTYQTSPRLTFEASRLQRQVDLRQQVYTTLAQSYEQARIDEVRNTPVVTVVDHPVGSARPTRSWALIVIAALILGGLVGAGASFGGEFWLRQRVENAADYQEFDTLRNMALNRLRLLPLFRNKWLGGEGGRAR